MLYRQTEEEQCSNHIDNESEYKMVENNDTINLQSIIKTHQVNESNQKFVPADLSSKRPQIGVGITTSEHTSKILNDSDASP